MRVAYGRVRALEERRDACRHGIGDTLHGAGRKVGQRRGRHRGGRRHVLSRSLAARARPDLLGRQLDVVEDVGRHSVSGKEIGPRL